MNQCCTSLHLGARTTKHRCRGQTFGRLCSAKREQERRSSLGLASLERELQLQRDASLQKTSSFSKKEWFAVQEIPLELTTCVFQSRFVVSVKRVFGSGITSFCYEKEFASHTHTQTTHSLSILCIKYSFVVFSLDTLVVPSAGRLDTFNVSTLDAPAHTTVWENEPEARMDSKLSPDGRLVAYVQDGDIWCTVVGGQPHRMTHFHGLLNTS